MSSPPSSTARSGDSIRNAAPPPCISDPAGAGNCAPAQVAARATIAAHTHFMRAAYQRAASLNSHMLHARFLSSTSHPSTPASASPETTPHPLESPRSGGLRRSPAWPAPARLPSNPSVAPATAASSPASPPASSASAPPPAPPPAPAAPRAALPPLPAPTAAPLLRQRSAHSVAAPAPPSLPPATTNTHSPAPAQTQSAPP